AQLAMAVDTEIEPRRRLARRDRRDVAVIDRFLKPAFGGTTLEPRTPPARNRLMRHIGVDIDTGHEATAKTEAAGDRIVVYLVLGRLRGVEGCDPIGAE